RRERLEVGVEAALVVIGPEPECLDGGHPDLLGAADVLVTAVSDEERAGGVDFEPPESLLEDRWVRLPLTGLRGEDRDVEAVAEPHLRKIAMQEGGRVRPPSCIAILRRWGSATASTS